MEYRFPRLHVFPHKSGDSWADLVEFDALDDPSVGHTIEGLVVVDPRRGEITALGSHLLKDGFVDEELIFAAIAPAAASFLHFEEQVVTFEKYVGPFGNDGDQDLVHSWYACDRPVVFRVPCVFGLWYQESHTLGQPLWGLF